MKRVFILMFVCLPVFADGIHVGAWSHHYLKSSYRMNNGRTRKYNETHGRLGYYRDYGSYWAEVGVFENSHYIDSEYAGIGKNYYRSNNFDLGIVGGYVSGYSFTKVYAAATASLKSKLVAIDFALAPKVATASIRIEI